MKSLHRFLTDFITRLTVGCVLFCGAPRAFALIKTNVVTYDPLAQGVSLVLPATSTYTLNVTCPAAVTTFPTTVNVRLVATSFPLGDLLTALAYVHFSTTTLTFTSAGQTLPVTVTMDFPLTALSLAIPGGAYNYQIFTDGWPVGIIDNGSSISAGVSVPTVPTGNPPTVTINTPVDGTPLTFTAGSMPATVAFQFNASTDSTSPTISSVGASFGTPTSMTAIPVSATGIGTAAVSGTGNFVVTAPGTYILQVDATNSVGSASDTNTYPVTISAPPPTVTISSPVPGSAYTYRVGDAPTIVTFNFSAVSNYGGVRTLAAKLDGANLVFTPVGIGTLTATGTIQLPYTTSGSHTVTVTTTDDYGTATAQSNFTINVIDPQIAVNISAPTPSQTFLIPVNATTVNVPYAFTTTAQNGFNVESVSATLGATVVTPTTTGLGTPATSSTGTLLNLAAGTYTLTAKGTSAGMSATASVQFIVKPTVVVQPPPTVTIGTPPVGAVYTRVIGGPAVIVPLTFTGTSNATSGVITSLQASLDGTAVSVTTANLGQKIATGSANLSVTSGGTHTISVVAVDAYGNAHATRTFTVNLVQGRNICGEVFFDLDADGREDCSEFGVKGVTVKLVDSTGKVVDTDTTDCGGDYCFSNVGPGTYTVTVVPPVGLIGTTPTSRTVTVAGCNVCVPDIGLKLDFKALQTMTANGFTIGYWKNNLDKAIAGKTNGTQVSKATLATYTSKIGDFALCPYDGISMKEASAKMGSTSSNSSDLLSKQLIASEYNYMNGAYLNGNQNLTFLFVWWGEYVLSHPCNYSSTYVLWAKDWFDAYNNSHGGVVAGPSP